METTTRDVYTIVTNRIIEQLEQGVIPWKQPWRSLGPPRNLVTGRPYRGINYLLLNTLPYKSKEFLTFKQVQDLGGRVNKGEKAHLVILWVWTKEEAELQEEVKGRKRPLLRYYYVFNRCQCSGIPERHTQLPILNTPLEKCEKVVSDMPNAPNIVYKEVAAYYNVEGDFINMPGLHLFDASEAYYATLFHELVHSTGHTNRLNRKELMEPSSFGSNLYSIEELTAEIGASYLCSHVGIMTNELLNSVAYIQEWLTHIKGDKRLVVYAASHAQRAADYILGIRNKGNDVLSEGVKETV